MGGVAAGGSRLAADHVSLSPAHHHIVNASLGSPQHLRLPSIYCGAFRHSPGAFLLRRLLQAWSWQASSSWVTVPTASKLLATPFLTSPPAAASFLPRGVAGTPSGLPSFGVSCTRGRGKDSKFQRLGEKVSNESKFQNFSVAFLERCQPRQVLK